MQDEEGAHERCVGTFDKFFKNPNAVSTYKPVLLAALVDIAAREPGGPLDVGEWISSEGGRMRVDLNLVAVPFAKFYWDMVAGFSPRHTPVRMADPDDPDRDIAIVGLINEEITKMKEEEARREIAGGGDAGGARGRGVGSPASDRPPTLEHLASDRMAEFRKKVIARSIKPEALRHLPSNGFRPYEFQRGGNSIVLGKGVAEYMRCGAVALRAALGELIARHLEENNPSARHIATMVNLNEEYDDKIQRVERLARRAAAPRTDVEPLYRASLDLAAGLARLAKAKG